jgi:hypothetical protein
MKVAPVSVAAALLVLAASFPAVSAEKPKPRVVLVEGTGPDQELSAFVARFESELSDAGKVVLSDARLSGAALGSLAAEPEGDAARKFRAEWPGEVWLAVSLSDCRVEVNNLRYSETSPEGYRVERVRQDVRVDCPTSLRLVDAATGKEVKTFDLTGTASFRRSEREEEESSELEGTRDAARKAAKKLPSFLKK